VKESVEGSDVKKELQAAQAAAQGYRLRSFTGKIVNLRDQGNVYGEKLPQEQLDGILDELVDVEYLRSVVLKATRTVPVSVKQIAESAGVDPAAVLQQIVVLRRKNLLELDRIDGRTPLYRAAGASDSEEA
jgi:DNA-binding transcriptional ArsR family regulator